MRLLAASAVAWVLLLAAPAFAVDPAALDRAYGTHGVVRTRATLIAVAADGAIVEAGPGVSVTRRTALGRIDAGFAASTPLPGLRASEVAAGPGRSAAVAGFGGAIDPRNGAWSRRVVLKLRKDGRPDRAFAADGVVELGPGPPPFGLAVAGDGSTFVGLAGGVLRLLPDGTPDPGFGRDGAATAGLEVGDQITRVQLDSLGRPLLSIFTSLDTPYGSYAVRVVRLRPDGSLDPAFSVVPAPVTISPIGLLIPGSRRCARIFDELGCGLAVTRLDEDGRSPVGFEVAGSRNDYAGAAAADTRGRVILRGGNGEVARLSADGSTDRHFGVCGIRKPQPRFASGLVSIQPTGRILVARMVLSSPPRERAGTIIYALRGGDGRTPIPRRPTVAAGYDDAHLGVPLGSLRRLPLRYRAATRATLTVQLRSTARPGSLIYKPHSTGEIRRLGLPVILARARVAVMPCRTATALLHVSADLRARLRRRLSSGASLTVITRVANRYGSIRARTTVKLEGGGTIGEPRPTDPG